MAVASGLRATAVTSPLVSHRATTDSPLSTATWRHGRDHQIAAGRQAFDRGAYESDCSGKLPSSRDGAPRGTA